MSRKGKTERDNGDRKTTEVKSEIRRWMRKWSRRDAGGGVREGSDGAAQNGLMKTFMANGQMEASTNLDADPTSTDEQQPTGNSRHCQK